jgi:hypothetical protein
MITVETTECRTEGCTAPPTMALRTTRPQRGDLRTTIYFDERTAPKTATRYCTPCGAALAADLIRTLA